MTRRLPLLATLVLLSACGPSAAQQYCAKVNALAQSHSDTLAAVMSCQAAMDAEQTRMTVAVSAGMVAGSAAGGRR